MGSGLRLLGLSFRVGLDRTVDSGLGFAPTYMSACKVRVRGALSVEVRAGGSLGVMRSVI